MKFSLKGAVLLATALILVFSMLAFGAVNALQGDTSRTPGDGKDVTKGKAVKSVTRPAKATGAMKAGSSCTLTYRNYTDEYVDCYIQWPGDEDSDEGEWEFAGTASPGGKVKVNVTPRGHWRLYAEDDGGFWGPVNRTLGKTYIWRLRP